ncbi:short-chain dehydrogenase [Stipitochalara longipes BDJ]|nr:short-chain dehydrogenase [Stipitochalara longipes BDJ]
MPDLWGERISTRNELFPPPPPFTEKDLPDLSNKVIFVTGGGSGCGLEFSKVVFAKNATVWITARSNVNGESAVKTIKASAPTSTGQLSYVVLDLADLPTIKPAVEKFVASSSRLDLLMNNAGVMSPPKGSKSKQGFELQLGTNVIGHHLLTVLLTPLLLQTAKISPPGSVRVIWTSSIGSQSNSPKNGGIQWDDISFNHTSSGSYNFTAYGQSEAGNIFQAAEFARRYPHSGILSANLHPGSLRTNLQRHHKFDLLFWIVGRTAYPMAMGAYTLLFAAFSPELKQRNGKYITAWGRFIKPREDLLWEWCDKQIAKYV